MIKQRLLIFLASAVLSCVQVGNASAPWVAYINQDIGYRIQYPADLFGEPRPDDLHNGVMLAALDEQAVLYFFGAPNDYRRTAPELAADLAAMDDIHRVTYTRVASRWFVLSGFLKGSDWAGRGIFYERIELSTDGSRLAGFRLEYSDTQRARFDHLIGSIGRSLGFLPYAAVAGHPPTTSTPNIPAGPHPPAGDHAEWCRDRYATYDPPSDSFMRFDGLRVRCLQGP